MNKFSKYLLCLTFFSNFTIFFPKTLSAAAAFPVEGCPRSVGGSSIVASLADRTKACEESVAEDMSRKEAALSQLARYIPRTYLDSPVLPYEFDLTIEGIRLSKSGDKLRIGRRFYSCVTEGSNMYVTKCDTVDEKFRHRWALPSFIDQKVALLSSIRAKSDPKLNMIRGTIIKEKTSIKVSSIPGSIRIGTSEYSIAAGVVFEEFKISGENSVIYRPYSEYLPGTISRISFITRRKAEERAAIEKIKRKKREANARKTEYIKEHRQAVARRRREEAEIHRRRMEGRDIRMAADLGITGGDIKDIRRRLEDHKSRERMRKKVAYAEKLGVDTRLIHITEERLDREIEKAKEARRDRERRVQDERRRLAASREARRDRERRIPRLDDTGNLTTHGRMVGDGRGGMFFAVWGKDDN